MSSIHRRSPSLRPLSTIADDDDDIYRGDPPTPPRSPPPPSVSSSSTSSSSSSSSNSSIFGGRLGALHTVLEHAISHWAHAWASTSSLASSSSSSSSSAPSIVTTTRSHIRRRKRRASVADLHNARSEREIAARIRAREESRIAPRHFTLYTPPSVHGFAPPPQAASSSLHTDTERAGVLHASVIDPVLSQLTAAIRGTGKSRRMQERARSPRPRPCSAPPTALDTAPALHLDYMLPDELYVAPVVEVRPRRRGRKGKQREGKDELLSNPQQLTTVPSGSGVQKSWWLDVTSPTWEDMRAIGKLLHLHPLTLEDILQQEPREKLDMFPKLGYYFIVFRTTESRKDRERLRPLGSGQQGSGLLDQGIVGEVTVYLIVFRDGICTFHFSDISEHADRVRNRILKLGESVNMSSDWILHGILDSIVDSFFPFLEEIEKEVMAIESLVFSDDPDGVNRSSRSLSLSSNSTDTVVESQKSAEKSSVSTLAAENPPTAAKTHFSLPKSRMSRFRAATQGAARLAHLRTVDTLVKRAPVATTTTTIHRMAKARRLVTSLTRFLATKSEVVQQVRKRLLQSGEWGLADSAGDHLDVYIYLGDVQDHILTLQQALAHYERMLSQSHPAYLSHLRWSAVKAKSGSDKAIVVLSTVTFAVLCVQTLIGLCSINVTVPANDFNGTVYHVFGIVIALAGVILLIYAAVVRWWWILAKRKRRNLL